MNDDSPGNIEAQDSECPEVDMSGHEYDYNYSDVDEILVNRKRYKKGEVCYFFGRHLRLTEFLGRGGFGSAWLVEDNDSQEKFVLKVAHKHSDLFEKSLELTKDKNIPENVQRIIAYDKENRLVLLNYIEGNRTLRTRTYPDARTGEETEFRTEQRLIIAWSILRKMLQTWSQLTKLGFVHGEIGTKHLLTSGGLIDPDIVDTVNHPEKSHPVGTPLFMAPEACYGRSHRTTDICSMGISLALYLEMDPDAINGDGTPKSKSIESQIAAKRREIERFGNPPRIPENSEQRERMLHRAWYGFDYDWDFLKIILKLEINNATDLGPSPKRFFDKLIDRICATLEAMTKLKPEDRPQTEEAVCKLMGVKPLMEKQKRVTVPTTTSEAEGK